MSCNASGIAICWPLTRSMTAPGGIAHVGDVMSRAADPPRWIGSDAGTATLSGRMISWFGSTVPGTCGRGAGGRVSWYWRQSSPASPW